MSKIDDMIKELCPEGVKRKTLGEIGTFIRGNGLQKKDFTESGTGCIHYGQIYTYYGIYTYKTKSFVDPDLASHLCKVSSGDLIIACTSENIEDVCKAVAWLGKEDIVTGGHACVFKHSQNPKYVSYFFQTQDFFVQKKKYARGAKVIDIKAEDMAKITIPVPPLPIQEEIVKILDSFTKLEAELEAELEARRKQYEFYRDKLLNFNDLQQNNPGG
ncbi:MAG: restriction endonuclease subunit S [Lentisphaeria bacterium]|nr:restriction endonuclease subunit S [Lentisphaeria bacterium]